MAKEERMGSIFAGKYVAHASASRLIETAGIGCATRHSIARAGVSLDCFRAGRVFAIAVALTGIFGSQVCAQEKLGVLLVAGDIATCVKPHDEAGPPLSEPQKREREIRSGRATA